MSKFTALLAGAMLLPAAANAATTIDQRGTRITRADGTAYAHNDSVGQGRWNGSSDPLPFDRQNGIEDESYFDATWTHTYGALEGTFQSAVLELGIWELDSNVAGSQIRIFTLNGVDLKAALDEVFEARPTGNGRIGFYELNLPSTFGASLLGGTATFRLSLQNGFSGGSVQTFNGAILDYAKLTINTGTGGGGEDPGGEDPVPEPATWAMMIAGFALTGAAMRRRRVAVSFA